MTERDERRQADPPDRHGNDDAGGQLPGYEQPPEEATREVHTRAEEGVVISIADLVGAKVVTADGETRGTVTDVLASEPPDYRIAALVVGASGWIHRLRITPLVRAVTAYRPVIDEVPWDAVDHWDGLKVVLRRGAEHEGVHEERP